jgi:glycosyltransferase involved in cell wall biosynthesis
MRSILNLTVIVPAYNEAGNIGQLVPAIRKVIGDDNELIVVDDGSTDGTASEVDPALAKIARHEYNRGKGEAMKTGIRLAAGDVVLFMGGDGQDDPNEIPILLKAMEAGADFVIGSRFIGHRERGAITPLNFVGNRAATLLFNALYRQRLTDTQAEFKCIGREKLMAVDLVSTGYEIETEMLIRAIRSGYKIVEVPVTRYPRGHGTSHLYGITFGRLRFGLRFLRAIGVGYFRWR